MKTENTYDVSVLVTAYNQNLTLGIVLKALQQQDFVGSWEIVVCDDGSDQDTLAAIRAATITTETPIRYTWQPRQGERRARSRNNALRCASGRIIIFVDGDIAVKRDFISQHVQHHTGGRTAVCGSRYWVFMDDFPPGSMSDGAIDLLLTQEIEISSLYSEIWFQEQYANSNQPWAACWGCNFSFVRDKEIVLFDEKFLGWGAEDQEFACRLHQLYNYTLQFVPSLYGFHLAHGRRSSFMPVRPRSQSEIIHYIRNLLYFWNLYPGLDMTASCIGISHFNLDADRNTWKLETQAHSDRSQICSLVKVAEEWLTRFDLETLKNS